jgi:hypothetical protein
MSRRFVDIQDVLYRRNIHCRCLSNPQYLSCGCRGGGGGGCGARGRGNGGAGVGAAGYKVEEAAGTLASGGTVLAGAQSGTLGLGDQAAEVAVIGKTVEVSPANLHLQVSC